MKIIRQVFTVQDMIDELQKVKDKSIQICVQGSDDSGYTEYVDIDLEILKDKVIIF